MQYKLKPELLLQKVGEEMVLLEPESGNYFTLNAVGAEMLEKLHQGMSVEQISQDISDIYDVSTQQAAEDFTALLVELERENLAEKL